MRRGRSGIWLLTIAGTMAGYTVVAQTFRSASAQVDLNDTSRVARISVDELKKLMANDGVVVIDVRTVDAYREAHIPGAISIPLDTVSGEAKLLKTFTKPIVTYCS